MTALQFLAEYPKLIGESTFWMFFSAKDISEKFEISIYQARKLIKALSEMGIVKRYANKYILDNTGTNIAYMLRDSREKSSKEHNR